MSFSVDPRVNLIIRFMPRKKAHRDLPKVPFQRLGDVNMNLYGVYFIDPANHISRPPKLIECIDEQEATQTRTSADGLP